MKKVILVTGASSGIGEATARELASAGHIVIMVARRFDRLKKLAAEIEANNGIARAYPLDVTVSSEFTNVVNSIVEEFGRLDVLVNNAGIMSLAPLKGLKLDEWEQMIDVNVKGVLYGVAAALPHMEKQQDGHVINVASIAAHYVFPTASVYCATKHAVKAISDGLRLETDKIRVTTISPGVVESEIANATTDPESKDWLDKFRTVSLKPEAIAQTIKHTIEQPVDVDINEVIIRPTASAH
ncbi:SDR family oxidoreductase [Sessilibacter corallicola]|uniref:SDR family oxidoreductase n=1 Tax=Sessilibacter corallicola TaxID=2904075 RepID=UPI001E4E38F2|nr:SDR family oxidoreductase [Sessilibacter corallicola]MCE2030196.1 SDR family oxidoreductase [Sessilibacter corallicola]